MKITNPSISVVINTTDRAVQLGTVLTALQQQSYPHFEVVVVVGPTKDNTLEVLEAYAGRVRVLRCPKANLSQSRNIGLLAARGDIVAFLDDDAVPSRRWLEQLAQLFGNPDLDATGGVVFFGYPTDVLPGVQYRIGTISALLEQLDVRDSWLEDLEPPGESTHWVGRMMGANMAFRREALLEVGGFDEFYVFIAEETDLVMRLVRAGKTVHAVKEAAVYHFPASSRNRVVFTYRGRWWLQTRSGVYYALKHGPRTGDSWRAVMMRCLHLTHGHWLWAGQLHRAKHIPWRQMWKIRLEDLYAFFAGLSGALFRRPQLIPQAQIAAARKISEPILPFQQEDAMLQPALDPITGSRSVLAPSVPPLRICLLSYTYPPAKYDGVGRLTNLMARGLYEAGHSVHVITHGEKERVSFYDGAYVHQIPYQLERYGAYRRFDRTFHGLNNSHAVYERVRSLVINEGIQIVDSPLWLYEGLVTEVSRLVPVVVRLVTALRQVSAIQNEHDPDTKMMGEMEQLLIEQADHWLPNTRATLEAVQKVYGLAAPEQRYTIVPYGIVPAPDAEIRPFDVGRRDPLTVLFVGRLEKRKGIQDLFAAIPQVLRQLPDTRFVIVGADNSMFDGFAGQTGMTYPTYFAHRYGEFASHVQFTGEVDDAQLQAFYQTCDVFVAPSLYESFGLVYLEAMNFAKPVIGCRAGGVPEVVEEGVTGVLVDPEAPEALAGALASLLRSPERLRALGLAGREQVLSRFSYHQMASNFADVYRRVIGEFKSTSPGDLLGDLLEG
ncbi:MAG: glycosyltransferase [Anaerolineae bacterium]|nr:glycosyltransferase [Anaerolineae bacterium]